MRKVVETGKKKLLNAKNNVCKKLRKSEGKFLSRFKNDDGLSRFMTEVIIIGAVVIVAALILLFKDEIVEIGNAVLTQLRSFKTEINGEIATEAPTVPGFIIPGIFR